MNDTVKRDNRKSLPRFLLVILVAGLVGGVVGFFSALAADLGTLNAIREGLDVFMRTVTPWAIPVCTAALLIPGLCLYCSAKKEYAVWDQECDEAYQAIEEKLSYTLLFSSLAMLADLFFLAAGFLYDVSLINALLFLISLVFLILLQQKVVDLTRRMNPEKKGSIYDVNFHKKWLDSCDELERAQIGQAALHAYKILNGLCPALWVILVLLSLVTEVGLLPILMVVLIWGVLQVSYTLECIRLSRRKSH